MDMQDILLSWDISEPRRTIVIACHCTEGSTKGYRILDRWSRSMAVERRESGSIVVYISRFYSRFTASSSFSLHCLCCQLL